VSVFKPSVRIRAPDGTDWEIYAYKLRVNGRREWDTDVVDPDVGAYPAAGEFALVNAIAWLVTLVPRLIVRLVDVGVAAARAAVSDEWTIEAIAFMPQPQSYRWTTTKEHKGQVLAQVEGHLARGHVPSRLRNATYEGWRRSAR
jgi:hypothetical protein